MFLMSLSAMATNKIYVTQAGASLVFDVLQDGDGNMIMVMALLVHGVRQVTVIILTLTVTQQIAQVVVMM